METALYNFVAFLVIIDPPGTAAMFAAMTRGVSRQRRHSMAFRATALAGTILFVFAGIGDILLTALGISLGAFRVAGGILLFLLAADMVFARQSGLRSVTRSEDEETEHRDDITVFPLAFPLIAGPGAMTSVLLLTGRAESIAAAAAVLGVLALVLLILLMTLLQAEWVLRLLGVTGSNVISRVLGIILAALAVQFTVDGLRDAFG